MTAKRVVRKSGVKYYVPFGKVMSRVGKLPVEIPANVKFSVENNHVVIEGPKGKNEQTFHSSVEITAKDGQVEVTPRDNSRLAKALYGTVRSIINGMVVGVVDGFSKNLIINGVGFRAEVKGDIIDLSLGYSHPIHHRIPENVKVTIKDGTKITIEGINKQVVGQLAASIKQYYPMEPYKGKGVKIEGDYVRRKEGKKTA